MKSEIVITSPRHHPRDAESITIEQRQKRRAQRRRRVAKRMAKRFPLMAVEFMQTEFPGYSYEEFVADISRKTRKAKSMRRAKSPLIRQGRYPLFEKAMSNYYRTGEQKHLEEAQRWRNRLYLPFELVFVLNGQKRHWVFHSETSLVVIETLQKIKDYQTWEELEGKIKEATKWAHCS